MIRYVWTFVGLLALTTLTLLLSFLDLGAWSPVLAMAIAVAKSLLVVLFFMHLVEQKTSSRFAFFVSVALLACLLGIAALDVVSRSAIDRLPPLGF